MRRPTKQPSKKHLPFKKSMESHSHPISQTMNEEHCRINENLTLKNIDQEIHSLEKLKYAVLNLNVNATNNNALLKQNMHESENRFKKSKNPSWR